MGSGITLTETDPADIPTPDAGKDTIFMDATASPPAPAYKDSSDVVTSLIGAPGPAGPAGPSGSITVNPNGALDGDGSGGSPLGVRVDGTSIGINASNELEALGGGSGTVINDAALDAGKTVIGAGGVHETVSALTGDLVDSASGTLGAVSVGAGLLKSGGSLTAHVDNETIGTDSEGKLEVIQNYVRFNGAGGTPSSLTATNVTGLPLTTGVTGVLPGANGGGLVRLNQIVTTASQATVDFTSISGSYQALLLIWDAQDTTLGTSGSTITMKVNNDGTSGNYTSAQRSAAVNGAAIVSTVAATATGVQIGFIPNAGNTGMTGSGQMQIVNYAGTTFHKRILYQFGSDDGTNNGFVGISEWRWKNTAAITRLTVTAGTAFTDGSVFTLYGMN